MKNWTVFALFLCPCLTAVGAFDALCNNPNCCNACCQSASQSVTSFPFSACQRGCTGSCQGLFGDDREACTAGSIFREQGTNPATFDPGNTGSNGGAAVNLFCTMSPTDSNTGELIIGNTLAPTPSPTKLPTPSPTNLPTSSPTKFPTPSPTFDPTPSPTKAPTRAPTDVPTTSPTKSPTNAPTSSPSREPTSTPTSAPIVPPPTTNNSPTRSDGSLTPGSSGTKKPTSSMATIIGAIGALVALSLMVGFFVRQRRFHLGENKGAAGGTGGSEVLESKILPMTDNNTFIVPHPIVSSGNTDIIKQTQAPVELIKLKEVATPFAKPKKEEVLVKNPEQEKRGADPSVEYLEEVVSNQDRVKSIFQPSATFLSQPKIQTILASSPKVSRPMSPDQTKLSSTPKGITESPAGSSSPRAAKPNDESSPKHLTPKIDLQLSPKPKAPKIDVDSIAITDKAAVISVLSSGGLSAAKKKSLSPEIISPPPLPKMPSKPVHPAAAFAKKTIKGESEQKVPKTQNSPAGNSHDFSDLALIGEDTNIEDETDEERARPKSHYLAKVMSSTTSRVSIFRPSSKYLEQQKHTSKPGSVLSEGSKKKTKKNKKKNGKKATIEVEEFPPTLADHEL